MAVPILAGAGLAGLGIAALVHAEEAPPSPPLCPTVTPDGGELDGIFFIERRTGGAGVMEPLPMIVIFHGAGMTAQQMAALAANLPIKARLIVPQAFYVTDGRPTWRDPGGETPFTEDVGSFAQFLEEIRRCRPTEGKPVLAGYDEGADVAYQLAVDDPDLISAVVGAGGRPPAGLVRAPTVVLHGMNDQVVPFQAAHDAWLEQVAAGAPVRFLRMLQVDHSFAGALQIKLWQEAAELAQDPHSKPFG